MARLEIEPRLPEYIPGALPLSYLTMGVNLDRLTMSDVTDCTSNKINVGSDARPAWKESTSALVTVYGSSG